MSTPIRRQIACNSASETSVLGHAAPTPSSPPPARVEELEAAIARAWEPYAAGKVGEAVAERLAAPYVTELAALRAEYATPTPPTPDYAATAEGLRVALPGTVSEVDKRELLQALDVRLYLGGEAAHFTLNVP